MESTDKADRPGKHNNGAIAVAGARADFRSKNELQKARRLKEANKTYGRGRKIDVKGVKDRKLRRNLTNLEKKYETAALRAKDAEILQEHEKGFLEPETELERTYKVRQEEIQENVFLVNVHKKLDLKLEELGPYIGEFTRNGRHLLLAGRKGHIATMDWREGKLQTELQLGETVRDARWLHNNLFFAVAQKNYVYIYDHNGVELHCLTKHTDVMALEFLPYHFLLATLGNNGVIRYQDVSTGSLVGEIPTKLGTPVSMAQNPYNAILHVGHQNGTVTLWSPNSQEPLVKLLAQRGPVRGLAVDREGKYMVTTQDQKMSVWDIRMFKELNSCYLHGSPSSVSISDTGLTAVGWNTQATVWKDIFSTEKPTQKNVYMSWRGEGRSAERVRWCPFEDVLGVGHSKGWSQIIVPGAGEANFDALEVNPYETAKQRQEGEIKSLLNKLQPEMIALDPNFIGNLDLRSEKQRQADKDLDAQTVDVAEVIRNKARGRNSALNKYLRKQRKRNVIDEKKLKAEEIWKERQARRLNQHEEQQEELGPALARFAKKE
ncbi:BING4CT domain-containing protein [Thozetella sp. PMI_491]|nr:BING4CT domain-containing protein [Thozetella sp. PMI_491]